MPYYRVVRGEIDNATNKLVRENEVMWEGTDLMKLEIRFPRLYFVQNDSIAGNLDVLRYIRGPKTRTVTYFLCRENETDNWGVIEDPRPYLLRHVGQRTGGHRVDPKEGKKAE